MENTENIKQSIINYLNGHHKMTLATCSLKSQPAAATVEYVTNGEIIYFGTNKNTNKVQNIQQNPTVAYAVDEDYDDWHAIQGVQIMGTASVVTDEQEAQKIGAIFGQKFPQMSDIPVTEDSIFVKIEPKRGHFIDYSKGFAHRDTVDFAA